MTQPDPRRERYAGAITDHLWGSPEDIDEATSGVMEIADQERQAAEAAIGRVRALHSPTKDWSWVTFGCTGHNAKHTQRCARCRACYPCPTITALDESAPAATEATGPLVDRPFRSHRHQTTEA